MGALPLSIDFNGSGSRCFVGCDEVLGRRPGCPARAGFADPPPEVRFCCRYWG